MSSPVIKYRLLTITMVMSFLLLGVKVGDILRGGQMLSNGWVNQAIAEAEPSAKPEEGAPDKAGAKKEAEVPAKEAKETKEATNTDKPAEIKPEKSEHEASGDKKENTDVALPGAEPKKEDAAAAVDPKMDLSKKEYTQVEVDLLQSLSKRRNEIESWSKQVDLKENLLGATEQRINDKIAQLKILQKQLDDVLSQYNQHEDAKIRSLVKIYENMKPADAARIFDELEMPILLEVVDKMSERKAAPIFANMNPTRAKELTVELAEQRKVQQPMVDAITASKQDAASSPSAETAPASAPATN